MKIYLAHPINGLSYDEIMLYYLTVAGILQHAYGYEVLSPMTGKKFLRNEKKVRSEGYKHPAATNHAIYERDQWMVRQADIVYVDLSQHKEFSIGCTMELAWASILGKHTILVIPEDSEYRHAFMLEAADIIFSNSADALEYLKALSENHPNEERK